MRTVKRKTGDTTKRLEPAQVEEMREVIRNGDGVSDIARRFGVSTSTVMYHKDRIAKNRAMRQAIDESKKVRTSYNGSHEKELNLKIHELINKCQALTLENTKLRNLIVELNLKTFDKN